MQKQNGKHFIVILHTFFPLNSTPFFYISNLIGIEIFLWYEIFFISAYYNGSQDIPLSISLISTFLLFPRSSKSIIALGINCNSNLRLLDGLKLGLGIFAGCAKISLQHHLYHYIIMAYLQDRIVRLVQDCV